MTALDLVDDMDGAAIDRVLRTGSARLPDLWRALELTPGRRGNGARRSLLVDSRDEPWSEAERLLHRLLRAAGLTGWVTNVTVGRGGFRCFVDVAFPAVKVGIEVDGFAFHAAQAGREQFDWDRYRDSTLVAHGWRMLHFTWPHLTDQPEWVISTIRATLARARRAETSTR
ncbi:MAG: endonuclease domain-containing protein [Propionibacteriaceae bacterium]